jgi:hypothetical protein
MTPPLREQRWARIALTVLLLTVTVGSFVSWSAGLQFQWAVIALLWRK